MAGAPSTFSLTSKLALAGAAAATMAYAVRQRRRMDFGAKVVVITGVSRGLGLELTRRFGEQGAHVVLLARQNEQLAEAARELESKGAPVTVLQCDVTQEDGVRAGIGSILNELGRIDVLINNAGIIQVGPMEHMNRDDFAEALAVHFWGPLSLLLEVIPHMKRQGHGRIVNITSIGAKVALPHLLPYTACKFALAGLSEGMRTELAKDNIYVTTVSPGLMRTGSHVNALFKGQQHKEFALFSAANAWFSTSSTRAARQIVEACRYGTSEVVITPQAKLLRLANGVFPKLVAETLGLLCRALPGPAGDDGDRLKRGWESQSAIAPSVLTRSADCAVSENNEVRQPPLPN